MTGSERCTTLWRSKTSTNGARSCAPLEVPHAPRGSLTRPDAGLCRDAPNETALPGRRSRSPLWLGPDRQVARSRPDLDVVSALEPVVVRAPPVDRPGGAEIVDRQSRRSGADVHPDGHAGRTD